MHTQETISGYLSTRDAARYMGVSVSALRSWRGKGIGPAYHRLGLRTVDSMDRARGRVVYDVRDLDKYMRSCRVITAGGAR